MAKMQRKKQQYILTRTILRMSDKNRQPARNRLLFLAKHQIDCHYTAPISTSTPQYTIYHEVLSNHR